jgi:undecaprenyl-diphosphatase
MPARRAYPLLATAAGGAAETASVLALVKTGAVRVLDAACRRWFEASRTRIPRVLTGAGTAAGKWFVQLPASLGLGAWLWRRRGLAVAAPVPAAAVLATVLQKALKAAIGRERPPRAKRVKHEREGSFPSGHAASTAAIGGTACYVLSRERLAPVVPLATAATLLVALAGGAKLAEEDHWLSDVLGGLGLGVAVAAGCCALYEASRGRAREA